MSKEKQKELETLGERVKAYKDGQLEKAPIIYKDFQFKVNKTDEGETGKVVVLSREEKDRDGETVMMDGIILRPWIKANGLPLIDSHRMYDSVTVNGLGALRNLRVEEVKGKKGLVGDPDFAPTPNGKIAEILYLGVDGGKPYFSNVSMGFAVYDYDNETGNILEWEPFEGSLVTVGAVMSARFVDKSLGQDEEEIAKNLNRFKQIHEPFKEFCKLFLSDTFTAKVGLTKTDNLLADIVSLYDIVNQKFEAKVEAPQMPVAAPQEQKTKTLTDAEIEKVLWAAYSQKLDQK